jgi:hypothetical protein
LGEFKCRWRYLIRRPTRKACKHKDRAQAQQQIATLCSVVRVDHVLQIQSAFQMLCCLGVRVNA